MTQKEFVIGLIENEIERDLTQRATVSEAPTVSEELEEQDNDTISNDFDGEDEDLDYEPDESEEQGMTMGR